jgi:hypothetical protein
MVIMVYKKEDGRFYKLCPICNEEQSYLRKNYAEESFKLGKLCKKCSNKDPENNAHMGYYKNVLRKSFAHKYKSNALLRGIIWDVSFEYLADLLIEQDFKCALTGWDIHGMEVNSPASLDRIDSSLGYIEGNLQWVTIKVNMMKQKYTQQDFIDVCIAVADKTKW